MPYHQDTFSLASITPRESRENRRLVELLERRLGRRLPESFRELVVLDVYPTFLATHSNSDRPLPVEELGSSVWRDADVPPDDILQFMVENQGVCRWGIRLADSDDPEVLVQVDGRHDPPWRHCAETFALWLRCQVLDRRLFDRLAYAAQAAPLSDDALTRLQGTFTVGPQTFGWPGHTTYRFSHPLGEILLCADTNQCDWWIAPTSVAMARPLLDLIPVNRSSVYQLTPEAAPALKEWLSSPGTA